MIAGLGQSGLTWKKSATANQTLTAVGFQKTVFAHKATGGETGINLASLTVPPEMVAQGFTQPSTATLLGAQLLFYSRNLTLWSSVHGRMSQKFQYTVSSSAQITFLGFTAMPGEIFEGTIDYNALPNVQVVTALAPPSTGSLAAGTTDFNVGFPFLVNQNPTAQRGSVRVTRNGQVLLRNTGNATAAAVLAGTSTGDYQEVDSGSGLGILIRFNKVNPDGNDAILVEPTERLVEMPSGSMMAVIETVQGQINTMASYVAALAGVSQTAVTAGAATTVALQTFGNTVQNLNQFAALTNQSNTFTSNQLFAAGSATAPAVAVNTSGAGLYSPASNQLGFTAGSLSAGFIDGSQQWTVGPSTVGGNLVHTVTSGTSGSGTVELKVFTPNTGASAAAISIRNSSGTAANDGFKMVHGAGVLKFQDLSGNALGQVSVTAGGAWDFGSTTADVQHGMDNSSLTQSVLELFNHNTSTGSDGTQALTIVKGSATNTTAQKFVVFVINNANTNSGQINANGASSAAFGTFSDARLKTNIQELPGQLKNIMALRPVEFDYRKESKHSGHQIGFVAQEMQKVYPDVVSEDEGGYLTITGWDKTSARLVKAIQELKEENDALAARLAALEAKQ